MTYEYTCKCKKTLEIDCDMESQPKSVVCQCGLKMTKKYSLLRVNPMTEV